MEELEKLLAALKDNLDPKLQQRLRDTFDILDPENQETILEGLRDGVRQKQAVEKDVGEAKSTDDFVKRQWIDRVFFTGGAFSLNMPVWIWL